MNKKEEKELLESLYHVCMGLKGTVDNQKNFIKILDSVVGFVSFLMKNVAVIYFILNLLIWRVFLRDPFNSLLDKITVRWSSVTEGYRVLILGFIGTIIAGVIAQIVGSLLSEKIKNILGNKKQ